MYILTKGEVINNWWADSFQVVKVFHQHENQLALDDMCYIVLFHHNVGASYYAINRHCFFKGWKYFRCDILALLITRCICLCRRSVVRLRWYRVMYDSTINRYWPGTCHV